MVHSSLPRLAASRDCNRSTSLDAFQRIWKTRGSSAIIRLAKRYVQAYPDLQQAAISTEELAWKHFNEFGRREGRLPTFDWQWYIQAYPDLQRAGISTETQAWAHYNEFGRHEGRQSSFDWQEYLNAYPDLQRAGISTKSQAWAHYNEFGRREGRQLCSKLSPPLVLNTPQWMYDQINSDFAKYQHRSISTKLYDKVLYGCPDYGIAKFSIRNNRVEFNLGDESKWTNPGRFQWSIRAQKIKRCIETIPLRLNKPLPDVDFLFCVEDSLVLSDVGAPVLVLAKKRSHNNANHIAVVDIDNLEQAEGLLNIVLRANQMFLGQVRYQLPFGEALPLGRNSTNTTGDSNHVPSPS